MSSPKSSFRVTTVLFKLGISLGLLAWLLTKSGVDDLFASLRSTVPLFFVAGAVADGLGVILRSYKWRILLVSQGARAPLTYLIKLNYIGAFLNNFSIGVTTGDSYRAYKTMDSSCPKSHAITAVILERLTGISALVVIVLIGGIASLWFIQPLPVDRRDLAFLLASGVSVLVIGYWSYRWVRDGQLGARLNRHHSIWINLLAALLDSARLSMANKDVLRKCWMLSLTYYVIRSISLGMFAYAGGVDVNLVHLLLVAPIVSFAVTLPISVNGIGVQETGLYFCYIALGVDSNAALHVSLLPRVGSLFLSLVGAACFAHDLLCGKQNP